MATAPEMFIDEEIERSTDPIEEFDIDGIRFDSAHAVPVMMKKRPNVVYVIPTRMNRIG